MKHRFFIPFGHFVCCGERSGNRGASSRVGRVVFILVVSTLGVFTEAPARAARTVFSSLKACQTAIPTYSGKIQVSDRVNNPCYPSSGYFIWATTKFKKWNCQLTNPGEYEIYLLSEWVEKRAIYSSSGPNAAGVMFCTATPYLASLTATSRTLELQNFMTGSQWVQVANSVSNTVTPVSTPYSAVFISRYGIPAYWSSSIVTTKYTNGSNGTSSTNSETVQGSYNTIEWQWDGT